MRWTILRNLIPMLKMAIKPKLNRVLKFKPSSFLGSRFFLLSLSIIGLSVQGSAQSDLFNDLAKTYDLNAELYFYASTLRMINIQRDPAFDEMVSDIDKMKFFQIGDMSSTEIRKLASRFREEENFEELMTMDGKKEMLYIMANDDDEYIALFRSGDGVIAVDLMGKIGVSKIPDLINSISADNFLNVFEVGKGERREHQSGKERN